MITGSIVAIVTPMNADGSLDLEAFRNLVDFHIREKRMPSSWSGPPASHPRWMWMNIAS